ncbi:hypothetical protein [Bradyrhizobium sp. LB11.1]|uniref:hypothetical protein n=1 Tax=Bradyrhizobium sp. LB11.1 TaxID=3156326 RepID=UPI0033920810
MRERAVLVALGVDASKNLDDIKAAHPGIRVTRCPPGFARGVTFMGGKPKLPRVSRKRKVA